MFVFIDGQFYLEKEAKISVMDRGFLFGDGAFTTIKVQDGVPEHLNEHLKRLKSQLNELNIEAHDIDQNAVFELINKNNALKGFFKIRITITGGITKDMGLPLRKGSTVITISPYSTKEKSVFKLALFSMPIAGPHLHLKTLSYLTRLFILQEAKNRGFDDAIAYDESSYILETAHANLFWIVGDRFYTPSHELACLAGITLGNIINNVRKNGLEVHYVKATINDIPQLAHVYCTGSLKGVIPVSQIEDRIFEVKDFIYF
jgi:branched-subunit amino acid aminotransferase/4-amino-4-deoxychorismate lyase